MESMESAIIERHPLMRGYRRANIAKSDKIATLPVAIQTVGVENREIGSVQLLERREMTREK